MKGLHLTADLYRCRCDAAWLVDAQRLQAWCAAAAAAAGLPPAGHVFLAGGTRGVAASVLMEDAHVCVHTWPEEKAVTLDVFVGRCEADHAARARGLMEALVNRFQPEWTEQRSLDRGDEG